MTNIAISERRKHKRVALLSEVECIYSGAMDRRPKRVMDISVGGLFLDCQLPPPIGTLVTLKFNLEGYDKPVCTEGEVRFTQDSVGMGIQFVSLDPEVREYLECVITQIDREG